jgi:hypothetical protein
LLYREIFGTILNFYNFFNCISNSWSFGIKLKTIHLRLKRRARI